MSDLETQLRETLNRVADATTARSRFDEIAARRRHRAMPRLAIPVLAFAAVVAVFAIPMFLAGSPESNVGAGESPAGPDSPVIVDPSWLTVEPGEIAVYNDQSLPGLGERAPLRSETIWCFYEDVRPVETHVAGLAVDEPLTTESLAQTCANETDVASDAQVTEEVMTACRGVVDPSEYEQWAAAGEMTVVTGDVEAPKPGFPVVLGWESDCVSESLDSNPEVALTADLNLETIDKTRELELAVVAASIENCLSYDESQALAASVVDELGPGYMHVSLSQVPRPPNGCFRPFIDQQWGWVIADIATDSNEPTVDTTVAPVGG